MFPKKNPESQSTITGERERGTSMKKGPAAMIATIAKSGTRKTEETMVAEERRPLFVISMARTKAIRQMNAPSPLRGKKSSIG